MYKDTREKMHELNNQVIDEIENLEVGSEEHSRAVKDAVLMFNAQAEEWKASEDQEDRRVRMEAEKENELAKAKLEEEKLKHEIKIEAEKLMAEDRKQKRELAGKAAVAAGMAATCYLGFKYEKEGYLMNRDVSKIVAFLPKLFKL